MKNPGIEPGLLYRPSPRRKKFSENFLLTSASAQAALVHRDVSHKAASRNSWLNRKHSRLCGTCPRRGDNWDIPLFFNGIQLSSYYKLQYTIPTIHTNIITRSISQSVFSINQAIPDITAKIIIVITIAAHNFIQSIILLLTYDKTELQLTQ